MSKPSSALKQTEPKKLKGRDLIVQSLEREGVEVIFGYPGGTSMEIHQGLTLSKKIRMILPRHEQAGAFAADGYARATGKPGVCLATSGPGATNLITGIMDCKLDSIPMVALTGQVPTTMMGGDAFQECDIVGATLPCVKHSYLVKNIDDIPAVVHEAFHIASTGRPGPVLIDFPKDIQQQEAVPNFEKRIDRPGYHPVVEPSSEQIKKAWELISKAQRPVVYAGGGIIASQASDELRTFVRKTRIPITTTSMGLGAYPEDDPLSLRMLGMHGAVYANIAMNKADVVIALGVRFDDRVTGKLSEFCKGAKFVHVDIDASEFNKNIKVDIPILGDVKSVLKEWNKMAKPLKLDAWHKQVEGWKKEFAHGYPENRKTIMPQHVIEELSRLSPKDAIISVGVGQHQMWTAQFFGFHSPRSFLCSSGLGSMGFGLPAAMGAQIAFPKRTVVDIDGDGSFLMNIQELQTLVQEKIPVKSIILNNQYLGMVAQWEDRFYESVRGHTYLGRADFAEIADAFGIASDTITKPDEVVPALKKMLSSKGPYVLDVKYPYDDKSHGHVIPMIPGGRTYLDSILREGITLKDYWKKKGVLVE
ncbi:MAG TPA: biosynthetic-type acetolactate synthase large subunit [Deltaproteobacteria bacterium]|nr:MAG: acetolactate synthase, large subunit, biosynthetic type [Deltaproteobacteria bacterium GWA2_45_12]HBF12762.1 biosynthetic-type acetolactate synthase large subunit [Deltaproteobacteria bacterium]